MRRPYDFLIPALIAANKIKGKNPRSGALLQLPADLSADERAAIRNACMIPGVVAVFGKSVVALVAVPLGKEKVVDDYQDEVKGQG